MNRWYEYWLRKASAQERSGDIIKAIISLNKAEKHTDDEDELKYLRIWRERLVEQALDKTQGG
jgi:hypothetical protein